MTDLARDRWSQLSARERGALIRAVRRGERVAEADRAVAVTVADKELARIDRAIRPRRLLVWRALHGTAAVLCLLVAVAAVTVGDALRVVVFGAGAALFGSSALLAQRRLDRQVARLAAARAVNAQEDRPGV